MRKLKIEAREDHFELDPQQQKKIKKRLILDAWKNHIIGEYKFDASKEQAIFAEILLLAYLADRMTLVGSKGFLPTLRELLDRQNDSLFVTLTIQALEHHSKKKEGPSSITVIAERVRFLLKYLESTHPQVSSTTRKEMLLNLLSKCGLSKIVSSKESLDELLRPIRSRKVKPKGRRRPTS